MPACYTVASCGSSADGVGGDGHPHLDEVTRVVDHLGEGCCQNDLCPTIHNASPPWE